MTQMIADTFKKPGSHTEGKGIQMLAQDTVTIFILNFQCKKNNNSAGFSFHLKDYCLKRKRK